MLVHFRGSLRQPAAILLGFFAGARPRLGPSGSGHGHARVVPLILVRGLEVRVYDDFSAI